MEKIKNPSPWLIKLAAVFLAVVLWFYVSYAENPDMTFRVRSIPVSISGEAVLKEKKLAISEVSVKTADAKIKARRTQMNQFTPKTVSASFDVSNISGVGSYDLPLVITLPSSSASLLDKSVSIVTVKVEQYTTKDLEVELPTVGTMREDYVLTETLVSPERVTVSGPKSAVDKVRHVAASVFDISSLTASTVSTNLLTALDDASAVVENVTLSAQSAVVTYTVSETKKIPIVIDEHNLPIDRTVSFTLTPDTVTVTGDAAAITSMEKIFTEPLDVSSLKSDTRLTLDLVLPKGISVIGDIRKIDVSATVK